MGVYAMTNKSVQMVDSLIILFKANDNSFRNQCRHSSCGGQDCNDCILNNTTTLETLETLAKDLKGGCIDE